MNSRTSLSATSLLTSNFWLISSTMADSVAPVSRSSRIREPTKLRLNICPCRISNTMAPSWPCVLRTPSETLYIGKPHSVGSPDEAVMSPRTLTPLLNRKPEKVENFQESDLLRRILLPAHEISRRPDWKRDALCSFFRPNRLRWSHRRGLPSAVTARSSCT